MIYKHIIFVSALAISATTAFSAPAPFLGSVERLTCGQRGKLVDEDGKPVASNIANTRIAGHQLTWLDGETRFRMQTGQFYVGGTARPEVSLVERESADGSAPNQKIDTSSSSTFYADMNYLTQLMQKSTVMQDTTSADGLTLTSVDITPDEPNRAARSITTTSYPGGTGKIRKDVLVSQEPHKLDNGYVYKTYSQTCVSKPSSLGDMSFGGFFSGVKKKILKFDVAYSAVLEARKKLALCRAGGGADCSALEKLVETAASNREALWKALLSTADLVATPPDNSGVDDGGGSSGGGTTNSCSSSMFCMGNGQCINGQCVDPVDQRCDNGIYSCAIGEMCCGGRCSSSGSCN